MMDSSVRYVAKSGSDTNDGLTWASAKASVAAAVNDLPTLGSGSSLRHAGRVEVGMGLFTETALPIEWNADLYIIGRKTSTGTNNCTWIRAGAENHLFAPTAGFTGFSHHLKMQDVVLDGRNVAGDFDLMRISKGGYNCQLASVFFRDSSRHGLYLIDNAIDLVMVDCTWVRSGLDDIYFYLNGAIPNLLILGAQADNAGRYFLNVEHVTNAQGASITILGTKVETDLASPSYDRVVNFKPRTSKYGNPVRFFITGLSAAHNGGGGTAVVYEEKRVGQSADFTLVNINGQGYTNAFNSAKRGVTSGGANVVIGGTSTFEVFA